MSVPFDPNGSLIIVPTRLFGPTGEIIVRFALDTGATRSIVSQSMMTMLGYDPAAATEYMQLTTGSGVESVPAVLVEKIEALGQESTELTVLCHALPSSSPVDGVLGLDFFRGRRLILDFRVGLVTLE